MKEASGYFLALTVAELVTAMGEPVWGITAHIIILFTVIVHSALTGKQSQQQLLLSLALVPLVRIISLSIPLASIPQIWRYPVIYTPLLVAAVVVMRVLNFRMSEVGISFNLLPVQLLVALSGFVLGVAEYFILKPEPMTTEFTWQSTWLPALTLMVTTGLVEEFIFRGVLQRTALESFGWRGIVYVSLLFAILHMGFLSWLDVIFVFFVALIFSWIVKKTGSLFGVILSHGITNITLFLVAPYFF